VADVPPEVVSLLDTADAHAREAAWARFVAHYSRVLLATCRLLGGDRDAVMDRYAYVLEHLRDDDYRRLRHFVGGGGCKFTTWLVVIARRLCLDHHRSRFGRLRADESDDAKQQRRQTRRDLARLVSSSHEMEDVADESAGDPETALMATESQRALDAALNDLDSSDRLLLRLRFDDALSAREIAQLMGFPSAFHVYRRLNQLFASLRPVLRRSGVVDPVS
jgi:RNA polymerase sigma factor (sigma-70 family)